jgi:hypothetical protein
MQVLWERTFPYWSPLSNLDDPTIQDAPRWAKTARARAADDRRRSPLVSTSPGWACWRSSSGRHLALFSQRSMGRFQHAYSMTGLPSEAARGGADSRYDLTMPRPAGGRESSTDPRLPVAPYYAIGLSTVVYGTSKREHIQRNLETIVDAIHASGPR